MEATGQEWQLPASGNLEDVQRQLLRFIKHIELFARNSGSNISTNAALYRKVLNAYFVLKKADRKKTDDEIIEDDLKEDMMTSGSSPLNSMEQGNLSSCFAMLDQDHRQAVVDKKLDLLLPRARDEEEFDIMTLAPNEQRAFYSTVLDEYNKQVEGRVREKAKKRKQEEDQAELARVREKRKFAKRAQTHRTHKADRYMNRRHADAKRHRPLTNDEKKETLNALNELDSEKLDFLGGILQDFECTAEEVREFLHRPADYAGRFMVEYPGDNFPPPKQWRIYDAIKALHVQQVAEEHRDRMAQTIYENAVAFTEGAYDEV